MLSLSAALYGLPTLPSFIRIRWPSSLAQSLLTALPVRSEEEEMAPFLLEAGARTGLPGPAHGRPRDSICRPS